MLERASRNAEVLSHAIRRFEIMDNLVTVSKCYFCKSVWVQDSAATMTTKSWNCQKQLYICTCSEKHVAVSEDRVLCQVSCDKVPTCTDCYRSLKNDLNPLISRKNVCFVTIVPDVLMLQQEYQ